MVTNLEDWDEAMKLRRDAAASCCGSAGGVRPDTPFGVMFAGALGLPDGRGIRGAWVQFLCHRDKRPDPYTHAVDGDISIAERYYRPASHAMKKLIRMVVEAAREGGIPVTICGSAANGQSSQHPAISAAGPAELLGQPAKPH